MSKRIEESVRVNGPGMLRVPLNWANPISAWERELRAIGRPKTTRYLRVYHLRRFAYENRRLAPIDVTRQNIRSSRLPTSPISTIGRRRPIRASASCKGCPACSVADRRRRGAS